MKIFSAEQVRKLDQSTIREEPISSLDLMERAGRELTKAIQAELIVENSAVVLFCGAGNNGGDGLVIARLLHHSAIRVQVVTASAKSKSEENQINDDRLRKECPEVEIQTFTDFDFQHLSGDAICIDALLGTGLNRPVTGSLTALIDKINAVPNRVISIDIPSGLQADGPSSVPIIKADLVLTLQAPKLSLLMSDSGQYVADFKVIDIGLHSPSLENEITDSVLLDQTLIQTMLLARPKFSHKGNYGHALLICGSYGKGGAAILAARAALRAGLALLTCHLPNELVSIMQVAVPEAMVEPDTASHVFSGIGDVTPYSTIGIGCGLGTDPKSVEGMKQLLRLCKTPMVIDADALNLIAAHPDLWSLIPPNSILTPHPGEFRRLAGASSSSWEEWEKQKELAREHKVIMVLKGAHTKIVLPGGMTYFNNTGNPGMATAGSGDVLTGIVTGLLGRGYTPQNAVCLGVYLHGLSGDMAAVTMGQESIIASDLVEHLPKAIKSI